MLGAIIDPGLFLLVFPGLFRDPALVFRFSGMGSGQQACRKVGIEWVPANRHAGKTWDERG